MQLYLVLIGLLFHVLGVVSAETKLLLVNAIHFKADWSIKFDEKQTKRKPFHVSKTETIDTEMMHITKKLLYLYDEKLEAKALKLTYFVSNYLYNL